MLGDDRGGRRLVPPQSIFGHAIRDRLHLVRSEALELRTPSSSRTPMALTVRQKRARNAGYQARWRARRDALARANPEVAERALLEEVERCERMSDQERIALADRLADAALGHLRRAQALAGVARLLRAAER